MGKRERLDNHQTMFTFGIQDLERAKKSKIIKFSFIIVCLNTIMKDAGQVAV